MKTPPSRKILAFVIMSVSLTASAALLTPLQTPAEIVRYVLAGELIGGLFCIGGQTLIDTVAKVVSAKTGIRLTDPEPAQEPKP